MNSAVVYRRRSDIAHLSVGSGSGGGDVDDVSRRLSNVETGVSELKSEVRAISANITHLATATSVSDLRSDVTAISAVIPHLATKADLKAEIGEVRTAIAEVKTDVASMETRIIRWFVATSLMVAGMAFSIAKFVH